MVFSFSTLCISIETIIISWRWKIIDGAGLEICRREHPKVYNFICNPPKKKFHLKCKQTPTQPLDDSRLRYNSEALQIMKILLPILHGTYHALILYDGYLPYL